MLTEIRADVIASVNDLIDDIEDRVITDPDMVWRAPGAISTLRRDPQMDRELRDSLAKRRKL